MVKKKGFQFVANNFINIILCRQRRIKIGRKEKEGNRSKEGKKREGVKDGKRRHIRGIEQTVTVWTLMRSKRPKKTEGVTMTTENNGSSIKVRKKLIKRGLRNLTVTVATARNPDGYAD